MKKLNKSSSQREKILGAAQHFGFGGFSYLFSITKAVKEKLNGSDFDFKLLKTDNVELFYDKNPEVFSGIVDDALFHQDIDNIVHLISSYEAYGIIDAWYYDVPNSFFTSLFWFWDIEALRPHYQNYLNELSNLKQKRDYHGLRRLFKSISQKNHHHAIFLAYLLAEQNYVLQGEGVQERIDEFPELQPKTIISSGIIPIPRGLEILPQSERKDIVIQLSGGTAPLIPFEYNLRYAQNILEAIRTLYGQYSNAEQLQWHFICNPLIHRELVNNIDMEVFPDNFHIIDSLPHEENLRLMARAKAFFLSPSLMSTYEAAYFEAPMCLLPEQNGGQPANYLKLKKFGFKPENNITIYEILGLDLSGDSNIEKIYSAHEKLFSPEAKKQTISRLLDFLNKTDQEEIMHRIVLNQKEGYMSLMGGFDGLEIISSHIANRILRQIII